MVSDISTSLAFKNIAIKKVRHHHFVARNAKLLNHQKTLYLYHSRNLTKMKVSSFKMCQISVATKP